MFPSVTVSYTLSATLPPLHSTSLVALCRWPSLPTSYEQYHPAHKPIKKKKKKKKKKLLVSRLP